MNYIEELARLIRLSASTVFFGGAGVSTESGIPDFRSEGGLYSIAGAYGYSPEQLLSRSMLLNNPELFFRFYREKLSIKAKPNPAHIALAALEQRGLMDSIITQNTDGLHQAAGSRNVFELHGTSCIHHCTQCKERYASEYMLDDANCRNYVPICRQCGSVVRPSVVLYEEGLDEGVVNGAIEAISKAELMIVGGTSLVVYPAAGLLRFFGKASRGPSQGLVLINKSATSADEGARMVIREAIGEVMSGVERSLD